MATEYQIQLEKDILYVAQIIFSVCILLPYITKTIQYSFEAKAIMH